MQLPFEPVILWRNIHVFRQSFVLYLFWLCVVPITTVYGLALATHAVSRANIDFLTTGFLAYVAFTGGFMYLKYHMFHHFNESRTYVAYYATPAMPAKLFASEMLWGLLRTAPASLLILVTGYMLGGELGWGGVWIFLKTLLVILSSGALGLLAASVARGIEHIYFFEAVLGVCYVLSGVFVDVQLFPTWLQKMVWFSPLYHGVEFLRHGSWVSALVLVVLGMGSFWLAVKNFEAQVVT